jgi:hypothetical protein
MKKEFAKYIEAETELCNNGFKMIGGDPLRGVIFDSENGNAVIVRTRNGYEIIDLSLSPKSIYEFIKNNPIYMSRAIEMINTYVDRQILKSQIQGEQITIDDDEDY